MNKLLPFNTMFVLFAARWCSSSSRSSSFVSGFLLTTTSSRRSMSTVQHIAFGGEQRQKRQLQWREGGATMPRRRRQQQRPATTPVARGMVSVAPSSSAGAGVDSSSNNNNIDPDLLRALVTPSAVEQQFGDVTYQDTTTSKNEFRVVFVLGGPGAGKGSQSALMEEQYPMVHFSVGELLRQEQQRPDSPHAELLETILNAGKIVPVEISLSLLQAAMEQASTTQRDIFFLVDGFPRNFDNLAGWSRCMAVPHIASIASVLVYVCPFEVLTQRILKRAVDAADEGSAIRSDDNLATLEKRFRTFEQDTMPVIETLAQVSSNAKRPRWSVVNIRGEQSLESVWEDTQVVLRQLIVNDVLTKNSALVEAVEQQDTATYQVLCDPEWFVDTVDAAEVMQKNELPPGQPDSEILNVETTVLNGKEVMVSYDHVASQAAAVAYRIERTWSHKGSLGWRNTRISQTPL